MATDAGGTRPLTALVAGNGQSSVSYTLPAGLLQYVQSVVATVDTSAAGDVTPLLTVTDDAGIVVADKQQGAAIDAGGAGRATWALRLTDEQAQGASAFPVGFYNALPVGGNPVPSGTHRTRMEVTFAGAGAGVDLLDTFTIGAFSSFWVKRSGVYCFLARIGMDPNPGAAWPAGNVMKLDLVPVGADPSPAGFWATQATSTFPLENQHGAAVNTVEVSRFMPVYLSPGVTYNWELNVQWDYVGDVDVSGFLEVIRLH